MELKKAGRWVGIGLAILFYGLLARATTVSGTIKVNQVPFNGALTYRLVYPTSAGSTGYLSLPVASDPVPIVNGTFTPFTIDGNDTMLPSHTYYQLAYFNNYGSLVATMNYEITGSTFDIGTAVPTPVTTNNISFLDLLGIRNLSTDNLTVLNCFGVGTGSAIPEFCPTGITGLKALDGIQFADAYNGVGSSSTTCGIAEAEAALPATGGTVVLPLGSCTLSTKVTHTKPGRWLGHGDTSSILTSTASDYLVDSESVLEVDGATLKGGGTAVVYVGTSLFVSSTSSFTNGGGAGIITNTGANALLYNTVVSDNTTSGMVAGGQMTAYSSTFVNNTVDGITANAGSVSLYGVTATGNTGSGVNVPTGSTATLTYVGGSAAGNSQSGVIIQAGNHHLVEDVDLRGNSRQLYGIYINPPSGANAQLTQVTIKDDQLTGNLTDDFYVGTNTQRVYYYPLANTKSASGYTENILAPNSVFYIFSSTTPNALSQALIVASPCTPASSSTNDVCVMTGLTFPHCFADTSYTVTLSGAATPESAGGSSSNASGTLYYQNKSACGLDLVIQNNRSIAVNYTEVSITGTHN